MHRYTVLHARAFTPLSEFGRKCFIDMYAFCAPLSAVIRLGFLPFLYMGAKSTVDVKYIQGLNS